MSLKSVSREDSELAQVFLELGRDYLSHLPDDRRERFLRSILDRQGEPERWLLLLEDEGDYSGFVHMKIDKDDRPGWGFIMEFYVRPDKRRSSWGRKMLHLCMNILRKRNVRKIWLSTNPEAKPFWSSMGFEETGEVDRYNDQEIMVMSIW